MGRFQDRAQLFPDSAARAAPQIHERGAVLVLSHLPLHSPFNQYLKLLVALIGGGFGLMVRLKGKGPVFYRQVRVGRDGKLCYTWKIRSMRLDSGT